MATRRSTRGKQKETLADPELPEESFPPLPASSRKRVHAPADIPSKSPSKIIELETAERSTRRGKVKLEFPQSESPVRLPSTRSRRKVSLAESPLVVEEPSNKTEVQLPRKRDRPAKVRVKSEEPAEAESEPVPRYTRRTRRTVKPEDNEVQSFEKGTEDSDTGEEDVGRPKKIVKKKVPPVEENDHNGEPGICIRCENKPANWAHFLLYHNSMLAAEQEKLDIKEKRMRFSLTLKKKGRLRCQRAECKKVMKSTTAMVYHEKTCGNAFEKIPCPKCARLIAEQYAHQHMLEHERQEGVFQRKGKVARCLEMEKQRALEREEMVKLEEEEEVLEGGRSKRKSAISARKKFKALELGKDEDKEVDDRYQPSEDSESDDDSMDEGVEEIEPQTDEEPDSDPEAVTVDGLTALEPSSGGSTRLWAGYSPTVIIDKLEDYFQRSLDILGFARCQTEGCDFVEYQNVQKAMGHHYRCRQSKKDERDPRKYVCREKRCKFKSEKKARLAQHYMNVHKFDVGKAREKAKEAPRTVSYNQQRRNDTIPSQAQIDALDLFGDS